MQVDPGMLRRFSAEIVETSQLLAETDVSTPFADSQDALARTEFQQVAELACGAAALGIECVPVDAREPGDMPVGTALLPGWVEVPPEVFPFAYQVLVNEANTKGGWAPNAVLLHSRMSGHIDVEKLLACAFVDSRRLPSWRENQTSTADFLGRRSAFVSGSYVVATDTSEPLTLEATTRYVVTEMDAGQYLTQLTVTIRVSQHEDLEIDVTVMNLALTIGAS